jgi:sugar phosphate isomerase/epimerase
MTDVVFALRAAAFCLWGPVGRWEIDEGIEWVETAIAALPPGTDPDLVRMVETLDWQKLEMVADELERRAAALSPADATSERPGLPKPAKPRRPRKPTLARLVAEAKELGVDVTVEPNGTATFRTGATAIALKVENTSRAVATALP